MLGKLRAILDGAGHLALWAGLYQGAVLALIAGASGAALGPGALLCMVSLAISTYLVDRAKLHSSLVDPADELTHPARVAFLRRRHAVAAEVMLVTGWIALVGAWSLHPLAMVVVPGAYAGVLWYAHPRRAGRRRPKQVFVVKNAVVALSIASLGVALIAAQGDAPPIAPMLAAAASATLHVFADAALCDLDDAPGDERFAIRTLPVVRGEPFTLLTALALKVLAGAGVLLATGLAGSPVHSGWPLAVLPLAGVGAAKLPRGRRRDGMELAFAGAVVLAIFVGW